MPVSASIELKVYKRRHLVESAYVGERAGMLPVGDTADALTCSLIWLCRIDCNALAFAGLWVT